MADVYAIGFPNGKLYVGITNKTAQRRFKGHVGRAKKGSTFAVHNAIRKYGPSSLRLMVLAQGVAWARAKELEVEWIARLGTQDKRNGYNRTAGGDGVCGELVAIKTHQRWSDPYYRMRVSAAISQGLIGKTQTEEHRLHNSKAHTGLPNPNKGKTFSKIAKLHMSEAAKRRFQDPEELGRHGERQKLRFQNSLEREKSAKGRRGKPCPIAVVQALHNRWLNSEYRAKMLIALSVGRGKTNSRRQYDSTPL